MNNASGKILIGQICLIVCCIFYLIWWSISYKPGVTVNRAGGINGILLLITAVSGIAGTALSLYGSSALPVTQAKMNGTQIILGGIACYVILLLITWFGFRRPVTTELLLITGWAMLEISVINSLNGAGELADARMNLLLCVIAAAFVISMILYVLYYRMEPMHAFHAAMVPLITEALSMTIIVLESFLY